jgi:acylphosphatase
VERRQVYYSGRVQGVGFRYTAREIAQQFAVAGYVENLGDGRVELVVEGETAEIDRFLAELRASMRRNIQGEQPQVWPSTGEFSGFSIRH